MSFHMPDSWYQPPEPIAEFEESFCCASCDFEGPMDCVLWSRLGPVEAECPVCGCGNLYELEGPDD